MVSILQKCLVFSALLLTLWGTSSQVQAESSQEQTVMTVDEMCSGCVKKITKHLAKFERIGKVECDIKASTVTVTPAPGVTLNPRGLWDVMAQIGKTPLKLEGPSGTFTTRP